MSSQKNDDDRRLVRCPYCGHEQEKIGALTSDPKFRDPPEGMAACKCQNTQCGEIFFTSDD